MLLHKNKCGAGYANVFNLLYLIISTGFTGWFNLNIIFGGQSIYGMKHPRFVRN